MGAHADAFPMDAAFPVTVAGRRPLRIEPFEACSDFTRVAAGRIAQPPKAAFVARLQPGRLPRQTARQLPDSSTSIRVEPSSTRARLQLTRERIGRRAGLQWPLGDEVTDDALEVQLFGRAGVAPGQRRRVEPDSAAMARELKRPGVTMTILWEEYREVHSDGYGYSRFCDLLRGFERRLTPVMRQHHVAGDKAFVDFSGKQIGIVDPTTGEIREAEIFVGVLGASNLTYAEATWTQTLPDWTGAHARMLRFFGGAPSCWFPTISRAWSTRPRSTIPRSTGPTGPWRPITASESFQLFLIFRGTKRKSRRCSTLAQTYILCLLRLLTFFSLSNSTRPSRSSCSTEQLPMRNLCLSLLSLF